MAEAVGVGADVPPDVFGVDVAVGTFDDGLLVGVGLAPLLDAEGVLVAVWTTVGVKLPVGAPLVAVAVEVCDGLDVPPGTAGV